MIKENILISWEYYLFCYFSVLYWIFFCILKSEGKNTNFQDLFNNNSPLKTIQRAPSLSPARGPAQGKCGSAHTHTHTHPHTRAHRHSEFLPPLIDFEACCLNGDSGSEGGSGDVAGRVLYDWPIYWMNWGIYFHFFVGLREDYNCSFLNLSFRKNIDCVPIRYHIKKVNICDYFH